MSKNILVLISLITASSAVISGCGQNLAGLGGSSSKHQISGTIASAAGSLSAKADPTVTSVVAVASDGRMTKSDVAGGAFSIEVATGEPIMLGFYNGTALVGYLKQNDVDWDSLPIMNPSSRSTALGTVEVSGSTLEAVPSIPLGELISNMRMDTSSAQLYGKIDDCMTVLSNLDIDGNGQFDFQETDKSYLFWADYGFQQSAEVSNMLGQFDENYTPMLQSYAFSLVFRNGSNAVPGAVAQISAPGALSSTNLVGTVDAQGSNWVFGIGYITTEAMPPSGTYTAVVDSGVGTLTFSNFRPSRVSSIGATNDIIYPVLKIATNESTGVVTGIYYKWKIVRNGVPDTATTQEIQSVIEDTEKSKPAGFIHGSPFIEFLYGESGSTGSGTIMIDRDAGFVDVSSYNKAYSDISVISVAYNLSSRAVHRFRFTK